MNDEAYYKAALERSQAILTRYLAPDGPSKAETIRELLVVLDNSELVSRMRGEAG